MTSGERDQLASEARENGYSGFINPDGFKGGFNNQGKSEMLTPKDGVNDIMSIYYWLANKAFAPEGNLARLGIRDVRFENAVMSGWGMFKNSKPVSDRGDGKSGEARLYVLFTPESGKNPIELVGGDMIQTFMHLQLLKLSTETPDAAAVVEMLEANMDDEIVMTMGFKSGKPVVGSFTVSQYAQMYAFGLDCVALVASRIFTEMSKDMNFKADPVCTSVKKRSWLRRLIDGIWTSKS